MKQSVTITLRGIDISLSLSLNPTIDQDEAIKIIQAVFPGSMVETLGEPIPGRLEEINLRGSESNGQKREQLGRLGSHIIKSPPYLGHTINSILLDELYTWRALAGEALDPRDVAAVDAYRKLFEEVRIDGE
jgi:hypothetical protein